MRFWTRHLGVAMLMAVLFLVAAAVLGGCSLSGGGTSASTAAVATSTTAAPTTSTEASTTSTAAAKLAWGDKGTWQGISVTAASPQTDPSPEEVGAGNKVVYCLVTITNNSSNPFDYNGLDFTLYDSAHQSYGNYGLSSQPDLGEGTVAPGASVQGAIAFEIPQTATPSGLEWQPEIANTATLIWGQP